MICPIYGKSSKLFVQSVIPSLVLPVDSVGKLRKSACMVTIIQVYLLEHCLVSCLESDAGSFIKKIISILYVILKKAKEKVIWSDESKASCK